MRRVPVVLLILAMGCLTACDRSDDAVPVPGDGKVSCLDLLAGASNLADLPLNTLFGTSRLFSSAAGVGKRTMTGYSVETYGDFDHGSYLRVEEVPAGFEGVLAEMEGAGAVTWMWSANPAGDLVIEIDGRETVYPFESFLSGKWLGVRYPFAAKTAEGYNLSFPIIHAKSCRISIRTKTRAELADLFYQVAWNSIETDGELVPFDLGQGRQYKTALQQQADAWLRPPANDLSVAFDGELPALASCNAIKLEGAGTIQEICIAARSKEELAGLQVEFYWDGAATAALSCPLYLLCGSTKSMDDVRSIPVTIAGTAAHIRWPMPFAQGAMVRLVNQGNRTVRLHVAIARSEDCSTRMRFGGHVYTHRSVDDGGLAELAETPGPGRIVGCIMDVSNRGKRWWGEGDPIIWLDDLRAPAWWGTGTEDYFGCAWCSSDAFQHPLRGQSCSKSAAVVLRRYHLMDALPFSRVARVQFEVVVDEPALLDYSALVLWYSETMTKNSVMEFM